MKIKVTHMEMFIDNDQIVLIIEALFAYKKQLREEGKNAEVVECEHLIEILSQD